MTRPVQNYRDIEVTGPVRLGSADHEPAELDLSLELPDLWIYEAAELLERITESGD